MTITAVKSLKHNADFSQLPEAFTSAANPPPKHFDRSTDLSCIVKPKP